MEKNYVIVTANYNDADNILELYRSFYGGPACWSSEYPNMDTIKFDLDNNSLYVMKNENDEIVATLSLEHDEETEALEIWDKDLKPAETLARVCVRKDMQNQGLAKIIISYVINELEKQGKRGVHLLVHKANVAARKSYANLGFKEIGTCNLYDVDYICMERSIEI